MFGEFSGRNRKEHQFKRTRVNHELSNDRHPPHLRGKEIGLFYARRSRERRKDMPPVKRSIKPLGMILLSDSKKVQIQEILDSTSCDFGADSETNQQFHNKFRKAITGTIQQKLITQFEFNRNPELDEQLFEEFETQKQTELYKQMQDMRKRLPSYNQMRDILNVVNNNQIVVISGETGCGKTTQVAQFILDDSLENKNGSICNIVCTQPRRISAVMVAERVASERAERLGQSVGYWIRTECTLPRNQASIVYCTTGILLKRMENDPSLLHVSHVILDEIHERDVMSDLIITLLKQVVSNRKDLKLILMSATLNAEKFSSYFNGCPHINIPGFTYNVQEFYLEDVFERTGFMFGPQERSRRKIDPAFQDLVETHVREIEASKKYSHKVCQQIKNPLSEELNLDLVLSLIINICETEKDQGAILVFLTGFQEISKLIQLMDSCGKFQRNKYYVLPLHSIMPTINQRQVFERPPVGIRKIIVATNIAETSITIDDVVFVIDCGKIKMSNYDVETNSSTLQPEWVSLANASQRKGRAGRVQPGICFHLFSKVRNMVLQQYQKPEILRTRLENTILTIKILLLGKAVPFLTQMMDCPNIEVINKSIELLTRLEALDQNETLTPLGYHLARLPIGPQIGKMLLFGAIFSCIEPVLSVAASLDFKEAFLMPIGKEKFVDKKKLELANGCKSDHILLHEASHGFENARDAGRFCFEYFLSKPTLHQLKDIKKQLMEYLFDMDFVNSKDPSHHAFNINSHNKSLLKAIICAGLYPNVATIGRRKFGNVAHVIEAQQKAYMHPKSILHKEDVLESHLIVFFTKLLSSQVFIHDATIVHPLPLIFFGDNYKYNIKDREHTTISIGTEMLQFKCSRTTNTIIRELKSRLQLIFEHKVSNPGVVDWQCDSKETAILRAVMELITSEDIGDIDMDAYDDYD